MHGCRAIEAVAPLSLTCNPHPLLRLLPVAARAGADARADARATLTATQRREDNVKRQAREEQEAAMQSHLVPLPGRTKGGEADDTLRTEPIGVYLYKRGNETQRRRELKIQASVVESKQAAEPKLTQKSMRMMMSVEKNNERRHKLYELHKKDPVVPDHEEGRKEATFQPHIDKNSKKLAGRDHHTFEERLRLREARAKAKMAEMRDRKREAELEGCTFNPDIGKSQRKKKTSSNAAVEDRLGAWQKRREMKRLALQVSVLLCTVTFYANLAHSLTRSP